MKKVLKTSIVSLSLVAILVSILGFGKLVGKKTFTPVFQKGMCYTTWSKAAYMSNKSGRSLEKLKNINVEWVAILTTWYQDNCFATQIFPTGKTPSDESVKKAIKEAHDLGLKVMVKPHLDILETKYGTWRGEIACMKEPDWDVWFTQYKNFLLHYAKIAEETGAEMLCMGTELTAASATHEHKWRDIIAAIRDVYKGDLTYAANWSEEYLQIRFWDALDYAGIDAYFPLSNKDKPTYEELMESWQRWVPEIEEWQKRVNKPVLFPEIGYRSSSGSARYPWEHSPGPTVDPELQKDCYRAIVDTFWNKEWFYGIYWWDWGTDVRMGGKSNRGFTPQNKPAQDYIAEIYKRKR